MKLKKVAALCKKNKRAIILNQEKEGEIVAQYISNGYAIFPLYELPTLDKRNLLTIFDVESDKWDEWFVSERKLNTSYMNPEDWDSTEDRIKHLYPPVIWQGTQLMICGLPNREIMIIDADSLGPVDSAEADYYFRENEKGVKYLTVKEGLLLTAVIYPYQFKADDLFERFLNEITTLGNCLRETRTNELMAKESMKQMEIAP